MRELHKVKLRPKSKRTFGFNLLKANSGKGLQKALLASLVKPNCAQVCDNANLAFSSTNGSKIY